jgi:hypothetical protein
MATVGFNLDMSHIKPDGIATWKFKSNDDTGHYSFGDLRDAKIAVRTLFDLDSYQRQRPFGIQVDASAKTLNTDKATVLEKLGLLGTESMNQIITAVNGRNYSGTLGFHWRFVCEGGMAKSRYLEIFADGLLMIAHASYEDLATLLTASPAPGTPAGGDLFTGWGGATTARVPAAFKSVSIEVAGDAEPIGSIKNERLIITGVSSQDNYGMSTVQKMTIECEFEMRQTSTELELMTNAAGDSGPGYTIVLADGASIALTTQLGFHFEHELATDTRGDAIIKVSGGGMIMPADWAALIT